MLGGPQVGDPVQRQPEEVRARVEEFDRARTQGHPDGQGPVAAGDGMIQRGQPLPLSLEPVASAGVQLTHQGRIDPPQPRPEHLQQQGVVPEPARVGELRHERRLPEPLPQRVDQ